MTVNYHKIIIISTRKKQTSITDFTLEAWPMNSLGYGNSSLPCLKNEVQLNDPT